MTQQPDTNSLPAHGGPIAAAAAYLQLDEWELRARLAGGRTLGQVAAEEGLSIRGLEDALLADLKWHLDADVAAGRVASERESQILTAVKSRIDRMVECRSRRPPSASAA
ncbi:MAG TPA: hypothetical protein VLV46_03450 [Gaiellaceae bacterium]|nr:hypothetical protein [Gaiellaceae bacterium]